MIQKKYNLLIFKKSTGLRSLFSIKKDNFKDHARFVFQTKLHKMILWLILVIVKDHAVLFIWVVSKIGSTIKLKDKFFSK